MSFSFSPFDLVALCTLLLLIYIYYRKPTPLPPGPRKLPLIGNLLDMPKEYQWLTYHDWSKRYKSDIIHADVAGQSVIILDTLEAATELLEKRSHIYSGRPQSTMFHELCNWKWSFSFSPYGESWRQHRRIFHQELGHAKAALQFRPQERKAAHIFLGRLLERPEAFIEGLRYMAGQLIMSIAYGIDVLPEDDPYIAIAEKALRCASETGVPGNFLVDSFPFLKYVPEWFPGAGFQTQAKEWSKQVTTMVDMPFEVVKQQITENTHKPSVCSSLLVDVGNKKGDDTTKRERLIQETAGTMYTAGADTTVAALSSFFLAMVQFPDVQTKAQKELDKVLGSGILPDFADEASLPYINALVKEVFRWRPVQPMALPHRLDAEDIYKGYQMPAGSTVIANSWAMLHNEATYPDPEIFRPERYLDYDGHLDTTAPDPTHVAFGFGRRACAGKNMAIASVWITVASVLAAFNIRKATRKDGTLIEPSGAFTSGIVSYTLPFECDIHPRSLEVEALIREIFDREANTQLGDLAPGLSI